MSRRKTEPPAEHRFRKGQSGNPKGRPRSGRAASAPSAFDVIINRTLTVTQGGKPREVSVEEALQHKTYQDALAGNRPARREVLKMIAKREQWFAAKTPKARPIETKIEGPDPRNADEAMLLLGIANYDPKWSDHSRGARLLLEPWAVQAALSRRGRKALEAKDVADIKRCTRDADTLRWPRRVEA